MAVKIHPVVIGSFRSSGQGKRYVFVFNIYIFNCSSITMV